jgi:hypothetical protein
MSSGSAKFYCKFFAQLFLVPQCVPHTVHTLAMANMFHAQLLLLPHSVLHREHSNNNNHVTRS